MTTDSNYVGLTHREIKALGGLSGECFRLYVAVSSFAYGPKCVCFPTWWKISERMGKTLDKANGRKLAKKLEEAGLVKRGEFGQPDRWRLVLKEQIIREREGNNNPQRGSNLHPREGNNDHPRESNLPPLNNKNKKENKDYSLLEINEPNESSDTEPNGSSSESDAERLEAAFQEFMGDHVGTSQTEVYNRNSDRYVSIETIKEKILSDWNWKEWINDYDIDDIEMILDSMNRKLKVVQEIHRHVIKMKLGL